MVSSSIRFLRNSLPYPFRWPKKVGLKIGDSEYHKRTLQESQLKNEEEFIKRLFFEGKRERRCHI